MKFSAARCSICDLEIAQKDKFTCADRRCVNAHMRETAEEAILDDGTAVYSSPDIGNVYVLIESAPRRMVRLDRLTSIEVDEDEAREALREARDLTDPTYAIRTEGFETGALTDSERSPGLCR